MNLSPAVHIAGYAALHSVLRRDAGVRRMVRRGGCHTGSVVLQAERALLVAQKNGT